MSSVRIAGLAALVAFAGCGGGGSPTGSRDVPAPVYGWPAGTVLQLIGGDTGAPVAATVLVSGAPYAGAYASEALTVDITAPGYLPRQTLVRTGETTFVLWPNSSRLPGAYTKALVYTDYTGKLFRLYRLVGQTVSVVPSDQLRADADAIAMHRQAIAELNEALAGRVVYQLDGSGSVRVTTRINAADPYCANGFAAFASIQYSGTTITGADIVFCIAGEARTSTMTHELGHTLGLEHSSDALDVMGGVRYRTRRTSFSARERLVMALMFQRRPGNAWPDDDRDSVASASGRRVVVVD